MGKLKTYIALALIIFLNIMSGCSSMGDDPLLERSEKKEILVRLNINIPSYSTSSPDEVSDSTHEKSKGAPLGIDRNPWDNVDFEFADSEYESVHTLRLLILENSRYCNIKANRLISFENKDALSNDLGYQVIRFSVDNYEDFYNNDYWVLAIGNEDSLPSETKERLQMIYDDGYVDHIEDFKSLIVVETDWDNYTNDIVMINNTTDEDSKRSIPFIGSKFINKYYGEGHYDTVVFNDDIYLFRISTKFSFYLDDSNISSGLGESYQVESITIDGLKDQEYLYYSLSTPYQTEERLVNGEWVTVAIWDRVNSPLRVSYDYTFTPENFGIAGDMEPGLKSVYSPALYFYESNETEYHISLVVKVRYPDGSEERLSLGPEKLPNLPLLPRNTHVKIIMSLERVVENNRDLRIRYDVRLMPYVGINLEPEFGI